MEDLAEECFNELLKRKLLLPPSDSEGKSKMHDVIRSLAIFLSKEETSFRDLNVRNSNTSIKLRRLSIECQEAAVQILDSVADKGALRTLLASRSDLLLDDERLSQLSHLRVLDIRWTKIEILPDSIGNLVHLRYLTLAATNIRAIPESIEKLTNLQFLDISTCGKLTQLSSGITQLRNLRFLDLSGTGVSYIPQGIEKLQQLNYLKYFMVSNNDSSSKLTDLNSLKQIRTLGIFNVEKAQSGTVILKELPYLSSLVLNFWELEHELAEEELFEKIIPPKSLEKFCINCFSGRRFPNWMALSSFGIYIPNLTKLKFFMIRSCTELPPLGQLPELRELTFYYVQKARKIGPEFLGGGVNSIAFPKLEKLKISNMDELEDWSFGAQVEENASPRLKLLPCLQKLEIYRCPLLKQLPKGLKYSAMKSLDIFTVGLQSLNDLPTEIEELEINGCIYLKRVNCPSTLKNLKISYCKALIFVERLDLLQELHFIDNFKESLPGWLLILLRERGLQNDTNDNFHLKLSCVLNVIRECQKGGIYWGLIQHIPQVITQSVNSDSEP